MVVLHPIQGIVVMLLVASSWISCDGLALHPRRGNTPSHVMLGILSYTSIYPRESGNTPTDQLLHAGYPVMD